VLIFILCVLPWLISQVIDQWFCLINSVKFFQLFEAEREIEARDQRIRDLQASIDVRMEADARNESAIQSLRQKLADYEAAYGSIEGAANRSELAIVTLQQQNNEAQQRIVDLESKIRCGVFLKFVNCIFCNFVSR
jgi:septal ring factor EnvC (AmiA/AmiB activator)